MTNQASGMMVQGIYGNGSFPMNPMFQPKGACGDSQSQPLWSTAMTSAPSDPNDSEVMCFSQELFFTSAVFALIQGSFILLMFCIGNLKQIPRPINIILI